MNTEVGPPSNWNRVAKYTCTVISLTAAYCAIVGLLNLEIVPSRIAYNAAAGGHVPAVPPPLFFIAACIFLLVAVALLLAWFTVPGRSATTLSLFVAFLALGYGVMFAGSFLQQPFIVFADRIRGRELLEPMKSIALWGDRGVLRLLSVAPMWTLAGALLLQFLSEFHRQLSPTETKKLKSVVGSEHVAILVVLVLASLFYVALQPLSPPLLLMGFIEIVALLVMVWLGFRHLRIRAELKVNASSRGPSSLSSSRRTLAATLVVSIGVAFVGIVDADVTSTAEQTIQVTTLFLPAACLLLLLPRALGLMPWAAYVPAAILIIGDLTFFELMEYDPGLQPRGSQIAAPWFLVCFLLSFWLATSHISQLAEKRKEQALILLAGIILATLLGLAWGATSEIWIHACTDTVTIGFCMIARHKDWLLMLPALTLAVFFAIALKMPGDIDATKLFRRTTLFASLGALVVFGFAVVEHLIDDLFGRLMADETPRFIAAGAVGMVVHPLKKRLESWIDVFLDNVLKTS
jgi:hypothetical protein